MIDAQRTVVDLDSAHRALAQWMWQHGWIYPEYHFLTYVQADEDVGVWAHGAYAPMTPSHTSN